MNLILTDPTHRNQLLPLVYTKPVADIRIGIKTIREKWEAVFNTTSSTHTQAYLSEKYPIKIEAKNILINASLLPTIELVNEIKKLSENTLLFSEEEFLACHISSEKLSALVNQKIPVEKANLSKQNTLSTPILIKHTWDIFHLNEKAIELDFEFIKKNQKSKRLSASNHILGNALFVEEGAKVEYATINTKTGPVYIGKNAEIMEGSLIRGPFALCNDAVLKMGSKIYGPTTIGPHCKVGGEITNSVFFAHSNKAHDGFVGNSVIGEWCNLGADTNTSNLKNNYGSVSVWNYEDEKITKTPHQFCGLTMGDFSKSGINTMFNTGTVVGVSSNIFGGDFPPKHIPSFFWGGTHLNEEFDLQKAIESANKMMERRRLSLTDEEKKIFTQIFNDTKKFRKP
ncbi:MAG: glucose-1-phosphate thymidylyltransferase [Bacteroidota bacterium]|nr:MAG: glucose-1-phosphate thymidylyltransferase [Bacteroidota bacterium]